LTAAFFFSRFLGSLLFGISTHDAVTYAAAAVLLLGVASGELSAREPGCENGSDDCVAV
jgi:hypothetical protein